MDLSWQNPWVNLQHLVFCILRGPHSDGHGHTLRAWCGQRRLPKAAEGRSDQQQRKKDGQALSHGIRPPVGPQKATEGWDLLDEKGNFWAGQKEFVKRKKQLKLRDLSLSL